jgi:putative adhesin
MRRLLPVVALRALLAAVLVGALLSGCAETAAPIPEGITAGEAPDGPNAGTAASHGQPSRAESGVTVSRDGSQYVAKQTVTITNDFGGAAASDAKLETVNGGVTAKAWSGGGYESLVTLTGRAPTEQGARDALAKMSVTHTDKLASGRLSLDTEVHFPSSFGNQASGSGSIVLSAPAEPAYRITAESINGGATVTGLGGSSVSAHTTNGGIEVSGAFNTIDAGASNGGIELRGKANSVKADNDNGGIEADLEPTASGSYTFKTTNGGMEVSLHGPAGFDVSGDCVNGGISIDLDGGKDVGTQSRTHKHVQSGNYGTASIKVSVEASTVNGDIDISG